MAFRFRCPKCNTTSFSIERDSRSYAPRGQPHELIFSCRCGKQLFGDQIEAEYRRQEGLYQSSADRKTEAPKPASTPSSPQEAPVGARTRPSPRARSTRPDQGAADPAARTQPAQATEIATSSADDGSRCGWKDCPNAPRPNSKYCSRDCSNKNARHRYKRRKASERVVAAK